MQQLLQLGVGGAIVLGVLYFLEKILGRIRPSKSGSGVESKPVEFWQMEFRKAIREIVEELVVPFFEQQTKIIERVSETQREIAQTQHQLTSLMEKVVYIQKDIQKEQEAIQSELRSKAAGAGA